MSSRQSYVPKDRLTHIQSHIEDGVDQNAVNNIRNSTGSPSNSAASLARFCLACGMNAWFAHNDLIATRMWFNESGRMVRMSYELSTKRSKSSTGGKITDLMPPLVANDEEQLQWFAQNVDMYDMERGEDRRTVEFWAIHFILALRGEWARLEARCKDVIAHPPSTALMKQYMVDHRFYLALAQADEAGMRETLAELLSPATLKARKGWEGGYTEGLICTDAVMYTKLAWRRGFRIDPGSSFVPSEWLPLDPPPQVPSPLGL
jgi:Immunity protein 49